MTEEKKQETKNEKQETKQEEKTSTQIELEEKSKLVDEYLDQLQRLQADFENYRKRSIKEKEEFRKYALEGILYDLLDVVDNIQRAIDATTQNHNYESLVSGINIVEKQFLELLKTQGAKPLQIKEGDKFDPNIHHAVSNEPSDAHPADTIIRVLQNGYGLGDRILRPAMVIVSSGQKAESKTQNEKGKTKEVS
jgi:molecular chaperone GrpE